MRPARAAVRFRVLAARLLFAAICLCGFVSLAALLLAASAEPRDLLKPNAPAADKKPGSRDRRQARPGKRKPMYARTKNLATYGRVATLAPDPLAQIVALYDGAIKFLRLAAADIERGDFAMKGEHVNRALDIIGYLQATLDFERGGEVAPTLDRLYASVTRIVLRASARPEAGEMLRAADLLAPVRDSWAAIASGDHGSGFAHDSGVARDGGDARTDHAPAPAPAFVASPAARTSALRAYRR